jgi:hypothetical protein
MKASFLSLLSISAACSPRSIEDKSMEGGTDSGQGDAEPIVWGEETEEPPFIHAAADVPEAQIDMVRTDHGTASEAWGSYGPLEIWIVGNDVEAAQDLDVLFCVHRMEMDPALPAEYEMYCLDRGYSFEDYAQEGGAALSIHRSEEEAYSAFVVTLSSMYPFPDETDYTVVTYHEYFHVYQNAHISTLQYDEREELMVRNPWWSEGGAEYMAQLLYSRQPGISGSYLRDRMTWKMESRDDLEAGERISDIPYGERARIAYDLGTWFVAYVIDLSGEEAFLVDFYLDLESLGFEGAFTQTFGSTSEEMLAGFDLFLDLPLEEQLSIIP